MLKLLNQKINTISSWGVKDFLKVRNLIKKEEVFSQSKDILKYYKIYSPSSVSAKSTNELSIIIPTRNKEYILNIVTQFSKLLNKSKTLKFEIIILNNFNKSITRDIFAKDVDISILNCDFPFNFSTINNLGVKSSKYDLVWFLNDDIRLDHFSTKNLLSMINIAMDPKVGAVGNILLYPDGKIQHGGVCQRYWLGGVHILRFQDPKVNHSLAFEWVKEDHIVDAVTGASLMIEKNKFLQAGGFNEQLPVDFNDVQLCMNLKKANLSQIVHHSKLLHLESASRNTLSESLKKENFIKGAKILLKS